LCIIYSKSKISDMSKEKNILQQAKVDIDSIVKLAQDNLLKENQERIQRLVEDAIDEVNNEEPVEETKVPVEIVSETIKVETDTQKVTIDDDGSIKNEFKEPEAGEVPETPVDAVTQTPVDATPAAPVAPTSVAPTPVAVDAVGDDEQIELSSDEDEIQITAEEEQTQPNMEQPAPAAPEAAPAPAPEVAPEVAPEAAPQEDLTAQLADVIKKMIAQQTGAAPTSDGDEVDIVDDEAGAVAPAAEAPAPAPEMAPAMEEMIELDEDDDLIELEMEEDEALVDEVKAMGQSHTVNRTAGPHTAPKVAVDNRTRTGAVNENTKKEEAHHEAIIAELKKENKSLKGQIGEFKSAFIELREHYNEVQTFNKKLALAYRVVSNGGLTEKEKVRISERFEAATSAEEAERIYKEIISEKSMPKDKGVIKSSAIPVAQPKKQPIYESAEAKRNRVLAGLDAPDQD